MIASDIPGYRDVLRDGVDGLLVPPGDALALAESLRRLALEEPLRARMAHAARERAERFAWPHVADEVLHCYEQALRIGSPATSTGRLAVRYGLAPADLLPRIPAERLPSLRGEGPRPVAAPGGRAPRALRGGALVLSCVGGLALALLALAHIGLDRVAASLLASRPGLLAAGLGLMCAAMFARAIAWHAILAAAPTWRRAKRRDAMQGTFIGVLMSSTLPARLGEPSRALIVARRLGRARETLPVVLGTMVSQTLLNLLALGLLGIAMFSSVNPLDGHHGGADRRGPGPARRAPAGAARARPRALGGRLPLRARGGAADRAAQRRWPRLRDGLRVFRQPRQAALATAIQLAAWALQWMSCWLLLMALGLDGRAGVAGAAAVLFAVNATAVRAGDAGQRRPLPGGLRGRARRRLPRLDPRRARLRHRAAGRRDRHRGDHGPARARQRGPLLEGSPPAHHARRPGEARAAARRPLDSAAQAATDPAR